MSKFWKFYLIIPMMHYITSVIAGIDYLFIMEEKFRPFHRLILFVDCNILLA